MAERAVPAASIFITIALDLQSQRQVYCVESIARNYTTNIIDTSSICNPTAKAPGTQDFSVDLTLQRFWDPTIAHYSEKFLHDALINKSLVDYTIGPASPSITDLVETGKGYITSATKNDVKDDVGKMDITITLTETPVLSIV